MKIWVTFVFGLMARDSFMLCWFSSSLVGSMDYRLFGLQSILISCLCTIVLYWYFSGYSTCWYPLHRQSDKRGCPARSFIDSPTATSLHPLPWRLWPTPSSHCLVTSLFTSHFFQWLSRKKLLDWLTRLCQVPSSQTLRVLPSMPMLSLIIWWLFSLELKLQQRRLLGHFLPLPSVRHTWVPCSLFHRIGHVSYGCWTSGFVPGFSNLSLWFDWDYSLHFSVSFWIFTWTSLADGFEWNSHLYIWLNYF